MKKRIRTTTLAATLCAIAGIGLTSAQAETDLTKLPPKPAEVCKTLEQSDVSLIEAAQKAEKESGGHVSSIAMENEGGKVVFRAVCYTESERVTMTIDSATGEIVSTERDSSTLPGAPIGDAELQKSPSGLMWYDMKAGDGPSPESPATTVSVHYTGWLVDGTKFDSSHDRGQPAEFQLSGVIPGWTEGVVSMKAGGKRKLLIPSDLAYGPRGAGGVIPPNAFLVFDVELMEVKE